MSTAPEIDKNQTATVTKKLRFGVVHDAILEDPSLSHQARVVLAWALGRQDGFKIWLWFMCKRLGLTKAKWLKVRKELMARGFFVQTKINKEKGRFQWENIFTDEPLFASLQANLVQPQPPKKMSSKPKVCSAASGTIGWLDAKIRIDHDNARDMENAEKILTFHVDQIEVAIAAAIQESVSGQAYPTAVLRILKASGAMPSPQPLSDWALAALEAKSRPPAGMLRDQK